MTGARSLSLSLSLNVARLTFPYKTALWNKAESHLNALSNVKSETLCVLHIPQSEAEATTARVVTAGFFFFFFFHNDVKIVAISAQLLPDLKTFIYWTTEGLLR